MRPHVIRSFIARCALVPLLTLPACALDETGNVEPEQEHPGRLVIVGGALQADNAPVYEAVFGARDGGGPVCVVPTASSDSQAAMDGAVETLSRYGGEGSARGVLISTADPSRAHDPSVVAELEACSGFYFTGGSQSRILDVFLPAGDTTEAYRALWRRWEEGAVVAGSSAGAAMMSRVMISGGGSGEAVTHGLVTGTGGDGLQVRAGMGFFEPVLDQHFLARGRIGRLLVYIAQSDLPQTGFGIDENTALVVEADSAVVVGASGVIVVDGRGAQRGEPNRAAGVRVHLAGAGDVVDLRTYQVRRDPSKTAVPVDEARRQPPADPFARWAFLQLISDLAGGSASEAVFTLTNATLRVVEDADFSASMSESSGGVQGVPLGLSAGPFTVDLAGPGS